MRLSIIPVSLAALATATTASAQWVNYSDQTASRVSASSSLVSGDTQEKDYAWADLDQDGDIDLVIVRKQPFTSTGRFPNVLLMNENGVLTDRTSQYASNANGTEGQPGSSGFLDSTNDRDVVIADINGDGWLDLVTCITLSNGQPDHISANRIYINKGEIGGVWQGFVFDDWQRIDHLALWGDDHHRFCSVKAGDVDGDGDIDLYYGDYQQGPTSRPIDHNDKLLFNDGTGYFTDATGNMTFQMVESSFGMETEIIDMNGDGKLDIVKADALNAPQAISVSYNSLQAGSSLGEFDTYQLAYQVAAYNFEIGDLNNDGTPDMIVSDDGQDRYVLNNGTAANGTVNWSSTIAFSYSGGGGDDGFGGNNILADLNNDGFQDAIIADVDVDIAGCARRCHIFRNLGNVPNVTLQEQINGGEVLGGITTSDLVGTFDVAAFDINGDGWLDLVVGRCTGTQVYMNEPPTGMTLTFVGGLPSMVVPGASTQVQVQANGLGGVSPLAGTGMLHYSVNGGGYTSQPMSDNGAGLYTGNLPALPNCADRIEFYVSVQGSDTNVYNDPPTAPSGSYSAIAALGTQQIYANDFEVDSAGWVVTSGATTGNWERAVPNGTNYLGQPAAPADDAQAGAFNNCFVTENGAPGGAAGTADVDGGPTDLVSPALDYDGTDGDISFQAWFYSSGADVMEVEVTNDGVNWVNVMTIDSDPGASNQWLQYGFRVGDHVTPSANVRVRFRVADTGTGSIVEAGVDVFTAEALSCDVCQETEATVQSIGSAVMSMCGGDLSLGTTTDLSILGAPAFSSGILFFDAFLLPTPVAGTTGQFISPNPVILGPVFFDASGDFVVPGLPIGGLLPSFVPIYVQAVYGDNSLPLNNGFTNALRVQFN